MGESPLDLSVQPCSPSEDVRTSDLCAQWKAADSGESASRAAWLFGVIGSAIGLVTLVAAIGAAYYARLAAKYTRAGAEVSKAVGEAQTRAYLACVAAKYELKKDSVSATIDIENIGNSPAKDVEVFGYVTINEVIGFPSHFRVARWVSSKITKSHSSPITTKARTSETLFFFWDYHFQEDGADDGAFNYETFRTGNEISFAITIRYKDVFGNVEDVPLLLDAIIAAHPLNANKKRSTKGKLSVSTNNTLDVDYPEDLN
jgi:hypothetical protein